MRIGIIGAGNIGSILAAKWVAVGHTVSIANSRGPETLEKVAQETGAKALSIEDVVKNVDVIVISIPQKSVTDLPKNLFHSVPKDVIIIDTNNYYPGFRDGVVEAMENGTVESQWVSNQIGRPVIKVFNSISSLSLAGNGTPNGTKGRIALPVAGDDTKAKQVVINLLDEIGFDGLDAGTLNESWRQQPGTPAYCTDYDLDTLVKALAKGDRTNAPKLRDLALKMLFEGGRTLSRDEIVEKTRSLFN
jgi:predicted dinucleotide-binding enzyme